MDDRQQQRVYVALGANLGDAPAALQWALQQLQGLAIEPLLVSSFRETDPVNCPPGSPKFLNAVAGFLPYPDETPESLFDKLQMMERARGRQPGGERNAPRTLDLDLIAFGQEQRNTSALTLPHPRAHLRSFVLGPLTEIAPDLLLPGQTLSVAKLAREL